MSATVQIIQEQEKQELHRKLPLILIHDGGGTIFQYHMLPALERDIYGIPNPKFDEGGLWEGGVPQVAAAYLSAIREEIGSGPILLGGWSFGGLVSIEIARLLQDDPRLDVRGLLLIDSACPWASMYRQRKSVEPQFRPTTKEHIRQQTRHNFASARNMISAWQKPATPFSTTPAILLRANDAGTACHSEHPSASQYDRDGRLGWSECEDDLALREVIEVPGDHFSLWRDDRLSHLADVIKKACSNFDQPVT